MAETLSAQIAHAAARLVTLSEQRGTPLDYSPESLPLLEEMATEAAQWRADMTPADVETLVETFTGYLLETARRAFGGALLWDSQRGQPVLVVGEPEFHVALMPFDKVRGRLGGDAADNLPFYYDGFAGAVRSATPGTRSLHV
ncbi:hypothetical protein ACLBXM_08435 [Xanthobacteraceae bacterium A53D]